MGATPVKVGQRLFLARSGSNPSPPQRLTNHFAQGGFTATTRDLGNVLG